MSAISAKQRQIAELTAAGCSPAQVQAATGFSAGYISQVLSIEGVVDYVTQLSGTRIEAEVSRQDTYDSLEGDVLDTLKERVNTAEISELTKVLDVVAKHNPRKSKLGSSRDSGDGGVSVVINLPNYIVPDQDLTVDARNRVTKVGNRDVSPLTAAEFKSNIKGIDNM